MELIDKSKLLDGLKKLKQNLSASPIVVIEDVESLVESLELKEVELEKEIQDHIRECLDVKFPTTNIELIKMDVAYTAKKFFELGLKAKQEDNDEVKIGETQIYLEDDGGEAPYDGKQWLDLSCMEYEIPKALFKDGDNVEIFIRKAPKGE